MFTDNDNFKNAVDGKGPNLENLFTVFSTFTNSFLFSGGNLIDDWENIIDEEDSQARCDKDDEFMTFFL